MPANIEISPYTQVGHLSWGKNRTWLSDPDHKGITLSSEIKQQIEDLGQTLGLSPEDTKQAIHEGEIAARIEVDLEFAATKTISGLMEESQNSLSPLACVARELSLIRMIQKGKIVGFVVNNSGKDILPKPVYGLTRSPHGDLCIGLTIDEEEKWIFLMSQRTTVAENVRKDLKDQDIESIFGKPFDWITSIATEELALFHNKRTNEPLHGIYIKAADYDRAIRMYI